MAGTSYAILSRYAAYGLHVRRLNPNTPDDSELYSVLPADMSSHPVNIRGFTTKYEAVLPVLRPWKALLTYVDKDGVSVLQRLAELGLTNIVKYTKLDWDKARIDTIQDWIVVPLTGGSSQRAMYINRNWDVWWTMSDGQICPMRNQVARHQYLIENLFALGLRADEFFPLL